MEPREQQLVARWSQMQDSAGATEDADRQLWFSEAAAFLQSADHWWCEHPRLTGHFAEIFLYHTQPVVKRLWDTVAQQLCSCALCVVNYHAAQVRDWSRTTHAEVAASTSSLQHVLVCRRNSSSRTLKAAPMSC